jgi:hypothetical protein
MDAPPPTRVPTARASRRRKRGCCSAPSHGDRSRRRVPQLVPPPSAVDKRAMRAAAAAASLTVPMAGYYTETDDDDYHTADEDVSAVQLPLQDGGRQGYRGFIFDGPVPPAVAASRPGKPFGSTEDEWPLVAEMQQILRDDNVRDPAPQLE